MEWELAFPCHILISFERREEVAENRISWLEWEGKIQEKEQNILSIKSVMRIVPDICINHSIPTRLLGGISDEELRFRTILWLAQDHLPGKLKSQNSSLGLPHTLAWALSEYTIFMKGVQFNPVSS